MTQFIFPAEDGDARVLLSASQARDHRNYSRARSLALAKDLPLDIVSDSEYAALTSGEVGLPGSNQTTVPQPDEQGVIVDQAGVRWLRAHIETHADYVAARQRARELNCELLFDNGPDA